MFRPVSSLLLGSLFLVVLGCTPALPQKEPSDLVENAYEETRSNVEETKRYAEQAESERKASEEILARAKSILEQAQQAESRCLEVDSKLKAHKKSIERTRQREKQKESALPKPPEKKPDLDYSPSDAPVEYFEAH